MASKGYIIAVLDSKFHYFTKKEKQSLDFKVIVYNQNQINIENYIEKMSSFGWIFICKNPNFMIFSKDKKEQIKTVNIEPTLEFDMVKSSYFKNEIYNFFIASIAIIFSFFRMFLSRGNHNLNLLLDLPLIMMAFCYLLKVLIWFYKNKKNSLNNTKLFHYKYYTEKILNGFMLLAFFIWILSNGFQFFYENYIFNPSYIYAFIILAIPGLLLVWYFNYIFKMKHSIFIKLGILFGIISLWGLLAILPLVFRVF